MSLSVLLVQVCVVLAVGRGVARLLRPTGQPAVIAEILTGILLGPSVLGALAPDLAIALFPPASLPTLERLSELGVVLFMFLVGLEFDPGLLRGQARAAVGISQAGVWAPLALGAALAVPLHARYAPPGVPVGTFALFVGTAMSVTAFPVLARLLAERRLQRTRVGAITLAAAAVGDVFAWCLLALLVALVTAAGPGAAARTAALATIYAGAVWGFGRPLLARLGPRAGHVVSASVVSTALLLVVGSAAVTDFIGVHALFGAFLVGAAMPRVGGLPAALAHRLEDVVTLLLLPLFFAASGLRTEIGLLATPGDALACAAVVAVAFVGKIAGTAVAARATGLVGREALAVGVLMNTRGLMEVVVLNVGLSLGVISPALFAMMVVMALVTTATTGPLLRRLLPEASPIVPDGPPGVLVCVSDPASVRTLLRLAAAWRGSGGTPVTLLHLTPTDRPHDYLRRVAPASDGPVAVGEREAAAMGLPLRVVVTPSGNAGADIVAAARDRGAGLVLLGGHRSALGRDALGGVAGRVLEEAPCAVGVVFDRGWTATPRVRVGAGRGPDASVARRLADHLVEGAGARVVAGEPDLELMPWSAGASPGDEGPTVVVVRGAGDDGARGG